MGLSEKIRLPPGIPNDGVPNDGIPNFSIPKAAIHGTPQFGTPGVLCGIPNIGCSFIMLSLFY